MSIAKRVLQSQSARRADVAGGPATGVALSIEHDPAIWAPLRKLAREFPREMYRAEGRAASIIARKIRASVRRLGNKDTGNLPALADLSTSLRPGRQPGGVLGENGSQLCRVQRRSGGIYAGYVAGVEGVFSRWQMGGFSMLDDHVRQAIHISLRRRGIAGYEVPQVAEQPPRPVVEPIARVAAQEFPRWVYSAMSKIVNKTLDRKGLK